MGFVWDFSGLQGELLFRIVDSDDIAYLEETFPLFLERLERLLFIIDCLLRFEVKIGEEINAKMDE